MTRPAPRNAREFFELFADYTPENGLRGMLQGLDFDGVEPRQIYFALLGRAPEKREYAIRSPNFLPLEKCIRGFGGEEFRKSVIPRFLEAFPEKQRLLFLHIPKTAGSQLSARLAERYPFLSSQVLQPGRSSEDQIYQHLRDAVVGLAGSDHLFVGGHNTLERYRTWRAIRFEDQLFGVVREPVRAIISQVNYILTRIFADEKQPDPDALGWRRTFQVSNSDRAIGKTAVIEHAGRILRNQGVVPANLACRYLGGANADAALERAICYDVELTDTDHFDLWCQAKWGIDRQTRSNVSHPYVVVDDLSHADREHIASITAEDARLYETLQERFARLGTVSVRGPQLA
jgi:hypothetical protein